MRIEVKKISGGFSLIELMIAIAILGILSAIAIPAYQSQIQNSRRDDAQTVLLQLQIAQQNYRLNNNSFATTAQLGVPAADFYTYTVDNVSPTTFRLVATAKSSQVNDVGCTTLSLDQSMNRLPADCW